ncbi:MAG: PTS system mannose/fructose/sorbose family transporter subunit IID [Candidatus Latescibacteria bacterium]|nr:PTS system mannose/fructose/sorbose family transporter subunit IID [Candidatus Latescibacterota bacterium]
MVNIDIIKSFLALLFLQTAWSYEGKQTIGFLNALITLKKHTPQKKEIVSKSAFNTNPYCTGLLLGLMGHYEQIPREWFVALQNTFGALGDEFFWRLLRPILLTTTVIILLSGYLFTPDIRLVSLYMYAPLLFIILFNLVSQSVRYRYLFKGLKFGRSAAISLANSLRKPLAKLYNIFAFLAGIVLIVVILLFLSGFSHQIESTQKTIAAIFLVLLLVVIFSLLLRTERHSSYLLIGGLLIFLIFKLL